MSYRDQIKYFDALKRYERKFDSKELQEYKMFLKRHKDDEDLDRLSMQKLKDILAFVATNMDKIIAGIMTAVKIFAIYKGVMIALNTVMAIQNAIMLANPITWIILGIVALTAGIIALVANWENLVNWIKTSDNWFAKITRGTINALVNAFKAVGKAISWVVDLFKKVWEWIKKIASGAFAPIQKIMSLFNGKTSELDVNMNQGQQALNPDATVIANDLLPVFAGPPALITTSGNISPTLSTINWISKCPYRRRATLITGFI